MIGGVISLLSAVSSLTSVPMLVQLHLMIPLVLAAVEILLRLLSAVALVGGGALLLLRRPPGRIVLAAGAGLALAATLLAFLLPALARGTLFLSPAGVVFNGPVAICAILVLATVFSGKVAAALAPGDRPGGAAAR